MRVRGRVRCANAWRKECASDEHDSRDSLIRDSLRRTMRSRLIRARSEYTRTHFLFSEKGSAKVIQAHSDLSQFDVSILSEMLREPTMKVIIQLHQIEKETSIVYDVVGEDDLYRFTSGGYVDALLEDMGGRETGIVATIIKHLLSDMPSVVCDEESGGVEMLSNLTQLQLHSHMIVRILNKIKCSSTHDNPLIYEKGGRYSLQAHSRERQTEF